jgi:hypothetical protein
VRAAGLGVAGVVAVGLLGGCRLRLEDDAPSVPFLPRKSIPDEALLIQTHREVRDLAAMAAGVTGLEAARALAVHHERQAQVLRSILTAGGVPASVIDAAPQPSSADTPASATGTAVPAPSPTGPAPVLAAALAAAEAQAVTPAALTALAQAEAQRQLLASISAHRAAAASMLGGVLAWPSGAMLPSDAAAAASEPTRQAVYAVQVAAARLPADGRAPYLDLLAALQRRESSVAPGGGPQGGEAPIGYALPFPVTNPDDAGKLVRTVLDALVARGLDPLTLLPAGSPAVAEVVRLQAEAAVLRLPWGGALVPFPGLVDG